MIQRGSLCLRHCKGCYFTLIVHPAASSTALAVASMKATDQGRSPVTSLSESSCPLEVHCIRQCICPWPWLDHGSHSQPGRCQPLFFFAFIYVPFNLSTIFFCFCFFVLKLNNSGLNFLGVGLCPKPHMRRMCTPP